MILECYRAQFWINVPNSDCIGMSLEDGAIVERRGGGSVTISDAIGYSAAVKQ